MQTEFINKTILYYFFIIGKFGITLKIIILILTICIMISISVKVFTFYYE